MHLTAVYLKQNEKKKNVLRTPLIKKNKEYCIAVEKWRLENM